MDEVTVESQAGLSRAIDVIARGKVPKRPIEDKRKPIAFGAALFGALATLIGFVLSSLLNPRVRYSDDLEPNLAQKIAVTVPRDLKNGGDLTRACFKLRNELDIRRADSGESVVVAVSGTTSAANTSGVAIPLSSIYSSGNSAVLLIDANSLSRVTREYSLDGRSGLVDVMGGGMPIAETVESSSTIHGNVDVLGSGNSEDDQSRGRVTTYTLQDFRKLIDTARSAYDVVLLDLGELAAGRHSALAASVSDQLIHITAAGDRKRDVVRTTELLDRVLADRYLLMFDKASHLDPTAENRQCQTSVCEQTPNLFKRIQTYLEKK